MKICLKSGLRTSIQIQFVAPLYMLCPCIRALLWTFLKLSCISVHGITTILVAGHFKTMYW